jgi:hypothetical protein
MNLRKTNVLLTILFFLLFSSILTYGGKQENPLVVAIQLFDEGKYTESEQILKKLLDEKPDHLMVNYYYGACRTENGHYGTNEIIYLLNGSTGEAPLKTEYFLAIQYHAKNRWDEALKHYTRFKGDVNEEEQAKLQLSEKIQQCYDKVNPFIEDDVIIADVLPAAVPREKEIEEYNPTIVEDSIAANRKTYILLKEDTLTGEAMTVTVVKTPVVPEKALQKTDPINFVINGEITYLDSTNFQTKKGIKYYNEGTKKKTDYTQKTIELEKLREQYGASKSYQEKQNIGEQILTSETNNYKLQSEYRKLLQQAKQAEIEYWNNASLGEKEAFIAQLDEQLKSIHEVELIEEEMIDTSDYINPALFLAAPDPKTSDEEKEQEELNYKIQLGAYSRGVPSYRQKQFDKLKYIRKIENYTDENGVVVYTTGSLTNLDDAVKMQNQVRQEGIEDAFVVPYFNGKRITLEEAKEIEAEK